MSGYLVFLVWALYGPVLLAFTEIYPPEVDFEIRSESFDGESAVAYNYDRIDEVKKECKSVLSSANALKPDINRMYSIKEELFFVDGDWRQEVDEHPLMPFDGRLYANNSYEEPLNLVSFWVTDIDRAHQSENSVSVSGSLSMGITIYGMFVDKISAAHPRFRISSGHSELWIPFQGIYTESEKNGGERVMCLLGNALLPSRDPDSSDPWRWVNASDPYHIEPPLAEDDRILLILRYPMRFKLTKRVIRGEMRSLNPNSNHRYFDEVLISSQLGQSANYEYVSEKIVFKACHPYPYHDNLINDRNSTYRGSGYCEILAEITREQAFTVLPNWRCNNTDEFCSKLGPFVSDKAMRKTDGGFRDVRLYMQNVKCDQRASQGGAISARVSAVFRAVSPSEYLYSAGTRSGLGNMTVVAEGIWNSSSGQLCMVGCPGLVDVEGRGCNSRICLYVPTSFSIKQRSIILGSISSIDENGSYYPLSFEKLIQPMELFNYFRTSRPHYTYTKIDSAGIVLERNEPFSFGTVMKKSLLQYPKLEDTEGYEVSLSLLSEDLTLHVNAVSDSKTDPQTFTDVQMEILSVGNLFARYYSKNSSVMEERPYRTKAEYTEKQLLLNVSAQLSLTAYSNFSVLFLEGLYDPHVGKLYLVGCRDIRASWQILSESMDLEAGLDCLIEVVVSYPPTTARWLINPTAKIAISSQRTEDDPLHFSPIKLETLPIMYRKQREDILSRRGVEGVLRILTLSLAIACISSQLIYIKQDLDSVPYISLVMLGVQAIGYSLPLVTGAEAIFKRIASESYVTSSYDLDNQMWFRLIDYTVKVLVMVTFLLTLRLCQKVWKSRIRLLTRAPLEPSRVPSDRRVLIATFAIHLIGFVLVLVFHRKKQRPLQMDSYFISRRNSHGLQEWERELEEYVGLVQDFFLLPQIIGSVLWQIDCKPLRKLYFIGLTLVRLLPHVYDYLRAPARNPYFTVTETSEFVDPNMDYYSKLGDVVIPVIAIVLAVIVYVQQRWNYEKLSQTLTLGQCKLLPTASRMYERLSSKAFEAELASGANGGNARHDEERDGVE